MSEPLLSTLNRLAEEIARDDARATAAPWIWTDETFLWNAEIDYGVLSHGNTHWPVTPDNREVIADARNRLPVLAHVLMDAAKRVDLLENLAIQDSAARNRLRSRVDQLEAALSEALDIAEWEASEYRGKREHRTRLPQLRAVLADKERR